MANGTYTRSEFAQKIKSKYPQYAELDDNELVDKILSKYPQYSEQISEKPSELEVPEATLTPEDTELPSQDGSLEPQKTREEEIEEHNLRAEAGKAVLSSVTKVPEWAIEPISAFVSTLAETGAGAVKAVEQFAYNRAQQLVEDGKVPAVNPETGDKIYLDEELEKMTPEERLEVFNDWYVAGDALEDVIEPLQNLQEIGGTGSGSISTEFAQGNVGEAARLTVNQSAAGLASLVPFLIPGGQVLGPAILGASVVGSEFEAGLERENATMDQIRLASYAKGANEFAWEFVTAGIIGKTQKLLAGGASAQAAKNFSRAAWKNVLGDSFNEGVSEGLTDTGNRIIDHFVFGDEFDGKAAVTGFIDSSIVGAIVGGKVSTFGQIGKNDAGKDIAANALKTDAQKAQDKADLDEIAKNIKIVEEKSALGTEGSLIDQVVAEEAATNAKEATDRIQQRQKDHVKTLEDMTTPELKAYAEALDKVKALEAEIAKTKKQDEKAAEANPAYEYTDTQPLEDAIQREEVKYNNVYNTVANWTQTTTQIDNTVKNNEAKLEEIAQEKKKIKLEEQAAAQHEAPNPVGTLSRKQKTEKLNKEETQVKKNIESLNKIKDQARPTIADAKVRKSRKKRTAPAVLETAPKEIKDQAQRAEVNADLEVVLT